MTVDAAPLVRLLDRSDELYQTILRSIGERVSESNRTQTADGLCHVSLQHGASLRVLVREAMPTSIIGLMRMQYEALVRACWALWAAPDHSIDRLTAPLSLEAEQAAKGLPAVNDMLKQIEATSGKTSPAGAYAMLAGFKAASWVAMNSFVHAGIHSLHRSEQGYPLPLVMNVVRNSNALGVMVGMTMAHAMRDPEIVTGIRAIQLRFADCLPELAQRHEPGT